MEIEKIILALGESVKTALIVIAAVTVLFFTAFYYLHEPFRNFPLIVQLIICLGIAIAYSIPTAMSCPFAQYKNTYIYTPLIELSYNICVCFVHGVFGDKMDMHDFLVLLLVTAVIYPLSFFGFEQIDKKRDKQPPVSGEQPV